MSIRTPKSGPSPSRPSRWPLALALLSLILATDQKVAQVLAPPEEAPLHAVPEASPTRSEAEKETDAKIAEIDKGMEDLALELKALWPQLSPEVQGRITRVFAFYKSNKLNNPYRNMQALRRIYETTHGAMEGRPEQVGDFSFELGEMSSSDARASYNPVRTALTVPPSFKPNSFWERLVVFHEVDHATSWADRAMRSHKPATAFSNVFLLTEEASRFALMFEVLDAKLHGRFKAEALASPELSDSFRTELASTLGLSEHSADLDGIWELAYTYFPDHGTVRTYPAPFLARICKVYKLQVESQGQTFMPVVEKTEGLGNMEAYQCPAN